jgi:hypothetical protein
MWSKPYFPLLAVSIVLTFSAIAPLDAPAQCYLNQGCKPVDYLNYSPNGTGQVYHGDGASNNGGGGWTMAYSDDNQCLSCHYGTDTAPYLMTGHKNTLRKIAPGALWAGSDGAFYPTTDSHYGSGSTYDWTNGKVTVGWCDSFSVLAGNGIGALDPTCSFPYYTLASSHAPTSYPTVPANTVAGGVRDMYYIFGGWQKYGGISHPENTSLGTIFNGGFTGGLYPNGNFSCARCHTTGYNFDASAPEPTQNTNDKLSSIPDAQFSRIPSDGYIAPGTNGTSSWYLTGITCERCHAAAWSYGSHPWDPYPVTQPQNEAATALCLECHRGENITMANYSTQPATPGSINPATTLKTIDHGYCSDQSGSNYSSCVSNSGNTWVYKPAFEHEAGPAFLNSSHARYNGNVVQNAQHSPDLSVTLSGTYHSQFSEIPADPTKNFGCTECHDPHQSTIAAVNATKPIVNKCSDCHVLSNTIMNNINHPFGPGTPFPTGAPSDVPGSCQICHMVSGNGVAQSHIWRINPDPNYYTYPTPAQLYTQGITAPNTVLENSALDGFIYPQAAWLDVDLACGQCHVGNDGVTTLYNMTLPPGMPGAHAYTRAQLAQFAQVMHNPDPSVPIPTFNPPPTTYTSIQTVSISDTQSGAIIYYTTDGSMPTINSPIYSVPLTILTTTSIRAIAAFPGIPMSPVILAVYSINLPQAPAPKFSPSPSSYSSSVSVTLSDTAGLPIYYTTDGSIATTSSTSYTAPIPVMQNTTIRAIAAGAGYLPSAVSTGTYSIQAPAPAFSLSSGTYYTGQSVTISDPASNATIYYTTNGTGPTTSSTSCVNPCTIPVSTTTTLKAMASGGGFAASNVSVAVYTMGTANPTFSLASGTYYTSQTVTISDTSSGASIYYTTNGATPTTSSTSCTSPCTVTVSTTTTIKAIAIGNGLSQSGVAFATYTISAVNPTFSPVSGTYKGAQTVIIADTTNGVTIYYTTNGSAPTTGSNSCSSPCSITVSATTTIKAVASGGGYSQSGVAVAVYTID